nr:fibronectin type III domain-containing protein [Actinomycetota bacterium]
EPSSCCGEIPGPGSPMPGITGPGGGPTGAVLLSPCIAPGTVTRTAYNHYSMLASVEDSFGLSHIGYAAGPGATPFGSDIYNRSCGAAAPMAAIAAPSLLSSVSSRARIAVRWSATTTGGTDLSSYTVDVVDLGSPNHRARVLAAATRATGLVYRAQPGHTYTFTVTATNLAGQSSPLSSVTVLVPSGVRPPGGHYSRGWRVRRVRGAAWRG